ncbi:hypothetical protein JCM11491_006745 [Sporobolomyces phaffii]
MGIGPELPPHLVPDRGSPPPPVPTTTTTTTTREDDEDSDSDYTPDLPPDFVRPTSATGPAPAKVVAGPQLPPHLVSSSSSHAPARPPPRQSRSDEDDDDDDDIGPGPLPPPAGFGSNAGDDGNDGARAFLEREARQRDRERIERERLANKKMQREEWMLVPPKEMDLMSSMDPTKLKSRSFQSGPKAQKSTRPGGLGDDGPNLWTETPAERQQRLQDEALGKKRRAEHAAADDDRDDSEEARRKRARDARLKDEVERHNSKSRNASLVDQHDSKKKMQGKGKSDVAEEPQGWDRDRDMSIGGRLIDDGKRKQMIKDAKGLGGRFGSSGFM